MHSEGYSSWVCTVVGSLYVCVTVAGSYSSRHGPFPRMHIFDIAYAARDVCGVH